MRRVRLSAGLLLAAALARPAVAQRLSYSYISYAGPEVSLFSPAADEEIARINTPVLSGDRIVTGASSRAEVVLASGNVLRIDAKSEIRFDLMSFTYESDDDRDLLYLARGGVVAEIRTPQSGDGAFRLETDDAMVVVEGRGLVRVDAGRRGTEVYVVAGEAHVAGRGGSSTVAEGEYALVQGAEEIEAGDASQPRDRFARFVDERRNRSSAGEAAEWVGSDYDYEASLAAFDENGSWVYAPSYERWCWRPTVSADWRPFTLGYWRWTPSGLTWVSYEPWGWLPYHYGTWCREPAFGWVWLPGTSYAPAWVWWSYAPDRVGWCPIGYAGSGRQGSPWAFRATGGLSRLPGFHGRIDPGRIDPRGWNYAPVNRIGRRFDPARDVVRGERVHHRPGDTAIVSTAPLRIDRGDAPAPAAVREALWRAADPPVSRGPLPVNEALTALLRDDPSLTPATEREVFRSAGASRHDEGTRPRPSTSVSGARRLEGGFSLSRSIARDEGKRREGDGDWRAVSSFRDPRRGVSAPPKPPTAPDSGWRSPASQAPAEVRPRPTGRTERNDTGWRVPRPEPSASSAAPQRTSPPPAARHAAPAAPKPAPAHHAPSVAPPRSR